MYDIRWIRENAAAFDKGLERRGLAPLSSSLLALDDVRRSSIAKAQATQERRNALSKEIGKAMGAKDVALADTLKAEVATLKEQQPALEAEEKAAKDALDEQLAAIPNAPFDDVPDGADEHDNVVLHVHGVKPEERGLLKGVNDPKQHFELGEALGQMDFEKAAKLSGSRFVVLQAQVARLSRAIGQFMLDKHTEDHGYTEVNPPLLVRDDAMFGTAQLPKFREDQFRAGEEHWLIPTAEVPLTNLARNQSSPRRSCRFDSPRSRLASARKPARPGAIHAACCASTSSRRSNSSRSRRRRSRARSMSACSPAPRPC